MHIANRDYLGGIPEIDYVVNTIALTEHIRGKLQSITHCLYQGESEPVTVSSGRQTRYARILAGQPFKKPELLFEKKGLIPALKQPFTSCLIHHR